MRETAKTWTERVIAWRESGLTSEEFSEGKSFRANALRNWAWRLGRTKPRRKATIPVARVVRAQVISPAAPAISTVAMVDAGVSVEIGSVRIVVRTGFDRSTMATLLDLLATVGGTR